MSTMAMPWMKLAIALPRHPKSVTLGAMLGSARAWTHVVELWLWAAEVRPDGDLSDCDDVVLARCAGWLDDAGRFVEALVAAGFLDAGKRLVRWAEHQAARVATAGARGDRSTAAERQARYRERKRAERDGTGVTRNGPTSVTRDVTGVTRDVTSDTNSNSNSNKQSDSDSDVTLRRDVTGDVTRNVTDPVTRNVTRDVTGVTPSENLKRESASESPSHVTRNADTDTVTRNVSEDSDVTGDSNVHRNASVTSTPYQQSNAANQDTHSLARFAPNTKNRGIMGLEEQAQKPTTPEAFIEQNRTTLERAWPSSQGVPLLTKVTALWGYWSDRYDRHGPRAALAHIEGMLLADVAKERKREARIQGVPDKEAITSGGIRYKVRPVVEFDYDQLDD